MNSVHRYPFPVPFLFWAFNLFAVYFIISSFVSFLLFTLNGEISWEANLILLFFGIFILFSANLYTEIISDEDGLLVRFSFWRFRVKWDDIVEIKPGPLDFLFRPLSKVLSVFTTQIVITKALTPFHRFYGLYGFSFHPSFLVHSNISGFEKLIFRIQNKAYSNEGVSKENYDR